MIICRALLTSIFLSSIFFINIVHGETVSNGHYYGATLLCDDGYKSTGGRCDALPAVTNGHYYGATVLCDDGYKNLSLIHI